MEHTSDYERKIVTSKSITFLSLLGLAFIVLKLVGVINWSWWLVLLPLYGEFVIAILILLVLIYILRKNIR